MKVYVRSRWKKHSRGYGYFWQSSVPNIIEEIESHNELISDYFSTIVLWGKYKNFSFNNIYNLYVSGINSGYTDSYNRPIKHTILWESDRKNERYLRKIMFALLCGKLKNNLNELINIDDKKGFSYDKEKLCNFGKKTEDDFLNGKKSKQIETKDIKHFLDSLKKYNLPTLTIRHFSPNGLLVAIGNEYSLKCLDKHKHLKWVLNTNLLEIL